MKKLIITAFLALIILFAGAQKNADQSVEAAVEVLKKAMIDSDSAVLNRIVNKDLSYGHSSGRIEDKSAFISNFVNGNSDFVTIELSGQSVIVKDKTAIVRHILSATTNDRGVPGTVKLSVMLVWIKKGGEWKLLARQAVKI